MDGSFRWECESSIRTWTPSFLSSAQVAWSDVHAHHVLGLFPTSVRIERGQSFLLMLGEKKLPVVWLLGLDGCMVLHPRLPFLFHGRFEKETEREDVPFRIPIDQLSYGSTGTHPSQTRRGTKAIVDTSKRTSTGGGETKRWPSAWWKKRR